VIQYNELCIPHEHLVEKYCTLLGTTFAGVVNYEDRVATAYLKERNDVKSNRIGCVGLSGGGIRSTLLQGTSNDIRAAVIVGAMTTYQDLYDHNVGCHTWMVFPSNWPKYGDWPDIAACRAPSPVMVQNDMEDPLYTTQGMRAADRRMARHYNAVGARKNYVCKFYPGPHKFDLPMQADAFAFLDQHLQP
jgi:dienelactone hydrolase